MRLRRRERYEDEVAPPGSPFRPLYDDVVRFSGQPVALVVAEESRSRALRPPWCASSMSRRRTSPTSSKQQARSAKEAPKRPTAAQGRRGVSSRRRCASRPNIACRSSTTTRWSRSPPRRSGMATAGSRSTTDAGPQNCRNYVANVFGCGATKCACCRLMSEALRFRLASAIRVAARRPGGAGAQALGPGDLTRQQMFALGYRSANVRRSSSRPTATAGSSPSGTASSA